MQRFLFLIALGVLSIISAAVVFEEWRAGMYHMFPEASTSATAAKPVTVSYVNLTRYQGRWYTIATLRTSLYQAACRDRTIVEYALRTDGADPVIEVLNTCRLFSGRTYVDRIAARVADTTSNAIIYIPAYGGSQRNPNYYIVGLGEPGAFGSQANAYSWTIVTGRNQEEAWIMARDPRYATAVLKQAIPVAEQAGIDPDAFYLEPQEGADFLERGATRNTRATEYLASRR